MDDQDKASKFDRLVEELQRRIIEQERAIYSAKVLAEAHNPTNMGRMDRADAYGIVHGSCGDTMEFYLRLNGGTIEAVSFITDGCGSSVACGNMLSRMVEGASLEEACSVRPEDVIVALDGLPEENVHCAELAVMTLREAMANQCGEASPRSPSHSKDEAQA